MARIIVAAFSSPETERLGRAVGFGVAVIAACRDPVRHAARLSRQWHAAWAPRPHWFDAVDYFDADAAASDFRQLRLDPRWMGRHPLPSGIEVAHGGLALDIPAGLLDPFSSTLCSALADRAFERFAAKPGALRRRYASGRQLTVAPRYSCAPADRPEGRNLTLVEDLFCFRPRDLPAVAAAAASAASVVGIRAALARLTSREEGRRHA